MVKTESYLKRKERTRKLLLSQSRSARDIGDIPPVVNPERRDRGRLDFKFFCEQYFPETFCMAWSGDHIKVIALVETAVLKGGLFAMAMPRGSGKTSLCEAACLWAILYGHRQFVALIGAEATSAEEMLASIRAELETGETPISQDFPEVCYPIERLERVAQRRLLYHGEPILMEMTSDHIILPNIPGSIASGSIFKVAGLTARVRGMKVKVEVPGEDGLKSVRPDLVIIDDPQTDESARSEAQCKTRERLLSGAVLGLAGPGKKISGIMPCTVIAPSDMADRMLDREKHPEWFGERTKMVYEWPKNAELWEQYRDLRADEFRQNGDGSKATAWYVERRALMDEGSIVAWPERKNHDEVSAIQHAMNLRFDRKDEAFFSEYQNEPLPEDGGRSMLTADQITKKLNGYERSKVPLAATHITAFIDVQQEILYYLVAAWSDEFTGYVLDYGAWPDQKRQYFQLKDIRATLATATGIAAAEGSIYKGLEMLTGKLLATRWQREDGQDIQIGRLLIDAGYQAEVVKKFCRQTHYSMVMASHGKSIRATQKALDFTKAKPGERVGAGWRYGKFATRHVLIDTNHWKTFVHDGLATPEGERGCISLWGREPERHRMFAEHATSEYAVTATSGERTIDEWELRPHRPDNHLFDCFVGSAVAASMLGCDKTNPGRAAGVRRPKTRKPLSQMGK